MVVQTCASAPPRCAHAAAMASSSRQRHGPWRRAHRRPCSTRSTRAKRRKSAMDPWQTRVRGVSPLHGRCRRGAASQAERGRGGGPAARRAGDTRLCRARRLPLRHAGGRSASRCAAQALLFTGDGVLHVQAPDAGQTGARAHLFCSPAKICSGCGRATCCSLWAAGIGQRAHAQGKPVKLDDGVQRRRLALDAGGVARTGRRPSASRSSASETPADLRPAREA